MKTVRLRNVELGDGDSKIIVPITGAIEEKLSLRPRSLIREFVIWQSGGSTCLKSITPFPRL